MPTRLSVCCLTAGRHPALLAGILGFLRPVADEIVVAAELERAGEVARAVGDIADLMLSFPAAPPADRQIAWLFGQCSGRWIFNVDDDEVPSPRLVAALPELVRREDLTHAWVARRWLYPTPETYLAQPPWSTEFQLRLVLADERFLQFSDVFHRPVVCHGPSLFLDAPLWHLDTALNPAARRSAKALAYERERPGMRLGGLAHNTGVYVPELTPDPALEAVPDEDREAIAAALLGSSGSRAALVKTRAATHAEIDIAWPGAPFPESLYRASLAVPAPPTAMTAGVQQTIDVRVTNESDRVWRWGKDARPEIRLGYRWNRAGTAVRDTLRLRTPLPADLRPDETQLVPVHVVAPSGTGRYELELDLVHERERERWFNLGVSFPIEVRPRERLAVIGPAEQLPALPGELGLTPVLELVGVLRDRADREQYGEHETVESLRSHLLRDSDSKGRVGTLWQLTRRTLEAARAARRPDRNQQSLDALVESASSTDGLVIAGPTWSTDAAHGREWWALAATALVWRLRAKPVVLREGAIPQGSRLRDRVLRWSLQRLVSR
jgi:hypothetical protein